MGRLDMIQSIIAQINKGPLNCDDIGNKNQGKICASRIMITVRSLISYQLIE